MNFISYFLRFILFSMYFRSLPQFKKNKPKRKKKNQQHSRRACAPGALTAWSPCPVHACDGAVAHSTTALRRSAGGKVFPSSMRGAWGGAGQQEGLRGSPELMLLSASPTDEVTSGTRIKQNDHRLSV
jgi:hypothetical protein